MSRGRKKLFSIVAAAAGLLLVYYELAGRLSSTPGERAFWLAVGALLLALGLIDLFQGRPEPPGGL